MPSETSPAPKPRETLSAAIKDDWEDSDDEEESQEIWKNANAKPPAAPMPMIVTGNTATSLPHQGVFEPKMRILKRPEQSNSSGSVTSVSTPSSSLRDREASYQAARARIFSQEDKHGTEDKEENRKTIEDSPSRKKEEDKGVISSP